MTPEHTRIFDELLARQDAFRGFLVKRLGDPSLADDVLQDVLIRSMDRVDTIRNPDAAVAWFYRALRNAVTDTHRRRTAHQRKLDAFQRELDGTPTEETEEAVCRCVLTLAKGLKADYADALRRTTVEEVPLRDYAEEAGITRNNAAVRSFRAREALKKEVLHTCGSCAAGGCGTCTCGT